jgi:hypothetical protein
MMTHTEMFKEALRLAITAPTDEQTDKAIRLAQDFARQFNLTAAQVEDCQAATLDELYKGLKAKQMCG